MADGILYCLNLNWSIHFRVGSRGLATFKTKFYVTSANNSFQSLPNFCHKEFHLWCCIGLELNIVTWSTNILKGIEGYTPLPPWLNATLVFHIKLNFLDLISNGLHGVTINSLTWIVAFINFYVGDIQLLCYHKMPKIWPCFPSYSHLFNFGSPLPLRTLFTWTFHKFTWTQMVLIIRYGLGISLLMLPKFKRIN